MDPRPRHTARVARLALRLFDMLIACGRQARARDDKARVILRAAAQLHGVRSPRRHASRQKAACAIVHALPMPPGWKADDWEVVALVIRYHRGTEPAPTHGRFARLRTTRQDLVRGLAGVLRVARALDHCGAMTPPRVRAEETVGGVRLRIRGLIDTREHAARLAAAKHLLEIYLRRPLLIESTEDVASPPAKPSAARRVKKQQAENERTKRGSAELAS
jgi:exopolyphosphatase/guanosine-5'-triphosphate,3'-diphosphate pyrophosphatase